MHGRVVTIHQPEFVPWLGFFNKIWQSDTYIILDNVQFKKNHFENRNKIRVSNKQGWTWITVPVLMKGRHGQRIKDVEINNGGDKRWRDVVLKSIRLSYQKSKYFHEIFELVEMCIKQDTSRLRDVNINFIFSILEYLNINIDVLLQSEMNVLSTKNQLLIDLIKQSECDTYLSGQSGKIYLDSTVMAENGITVRYQAFEHPHYIQLHGGFLEGMSILDLLFNFGKDSVGYIEGDMYE